jgi:uncharacterized membrane protein
MPLLLLAGERERTEAFMVSLSRKKNEQDPGPDEDHQNSQQPKETDPIEQNIKIIADLHKRAEREASPQQRAIEKVTAFLGRPRFLFLILITVTLWMLVNIVLALSGLPSFDPSPFLWLQGILSLGALLQTTVVLITQNRQDKMAERRIQLDLQVSLLLDQKMSKLIAMIDEQRQNNPSGKKRRDPQAEAMKEATDPHQAIASFDRLLNENEETS